MNVNLRPMDEAAIGEWLDRSRAAYVAELLAGGVGEAAATRMAAAQRAAAFPGGRPANGHLLFDVLADGVKAGHLWIGPLASDDQEHWWVWDIEINETWRGRGLGRAAMELAEHEAMARGGVEIGLTVVAKNKPARHLYESLGYREASVRMRKPLDIRSGAPRTTESEGTCS
jgi:ribosomal protein S18 acetylase RimI-like enzyme